MTRIFSCTTPFAIGEIWLNFQISPKRIAYHPIKHSDRLCPGLGAMEAGREAKDDDDEKAVHAFITGLHRDHRVSDAAFDAIKDAFGEEATLELTALAGYYTLISMVLNTFEVHPPEGGTTFTK